MGLKFSSKHLNQAQAFKLIEIFLSKKPSSDELFYFADKFAHGVIADVMWSSVVDKIWLRLRSDKYILQPYIGTRSGVFRFYPGSVIRGGYDPTIRIWFVTF